LSILFLIPGKIEGIRANPGSPAMPGGFRTIRTGSPSHTGSPGIHFSKQDFWQVRNLLPLSFPAPEGCFSNPREGMRPLRLSPSAA